eukprot:m.119389 g.119389  ORF g.119389 m.119389 type:complete len:76 (+) comp28733_c0_seq1:1936-2163(+)
MNVPVTIIGRCIFLHCKIALFAGVLVFASQKANPPTPRPVTPTMAPTTLRNLPKIMLITFSVIFNNEKKKNLKKN